MRRLFPVTDPAPSATGTDHVWSLAELAALYAYPEPLPDGGVLRANMVTTLDGAASLDGRSQGISGPADMRVFGVLRALADVVVVGAGTVRAEGYRPAKAREAFAAAREAAGQAPAAAIAVVSATLDLDFTTPLFTAPVVPTLVLTGADAPAERVAAAKEAGAEVVVTGPGPGADPGRVRAVLAARGLRRQLAEGGPHLLGTLIAADAVDELCLTVSPFLAAGEASRIAHAAPAPAPPARLRPASILTEDG
ncbi:dihydrofolate reductase family protein, partial [Streptomyces sp. SPB074]|uniref:dihydrofolate reductase family protein n=1 Tax=Streptomyces sp. (strain SPB074) TaxID=465543 RepID=UPI0001D1E244